MDIRAVSGPATNSRAGASLAQAPRPDEQADPVTNTDPGSNSRGSPKPVQHQDAAREAALQQLALAISERGGARFRVDEATDRIVIQILDQNDQVIKQIPPDELLRIISKSRELQALLFDELV